MAVGRITAHHLGAPRETPKAAAIIVRVIDQTSGRLGRACRVGRD